MGISWDLYTGPLCYNSTNEKITQFVKRVREQYKQNYKITKNFVCQKCYGMYSQMDCAGYDDYYPQCSEFDTIHELKNHLLNKHSILFTFDKFDQRAPPRGVEYYKANYSRIYRWRECGYDVKTKRQRFYITNMKAKRKEIDLEIYRSIKDDNTLTKTEWFCPCSNCKYKPSTFGTLVQHLKCTHNIKDNQKIRDFILLHYRTGYCYETKKRILANLIPITDIVNTYLLPYCDFYHQKCKCKTCIKKPWYYRGWI